MNPASILPPSHTERLEQAAREFLDAAETLALEHHTSEVLGGYPAEIQRRLIVALAAQALTQPGSWRLQSMDVNDIAMGIGSALGSASAEMGEAASADMVRAMIQGYTIGRNEGITARLQFITAGRAN